MPYDSSAAFGKQIDDALKIAFQYGSIDGSHHKAWVIDQMVRALTGETYDSWIAQHNKGESESATYEWDTGIAP